MAYLYNACLKIVFKPSKSHFSDKVLIHLINQQIMKSAFVTILFLSIGSSLQSQSPGGTTILQSQFINPCGNDGANEFIISTTGSSPVNINDFALASIDHMSGVQPNFNFYWWGKNVISAPSPTFTSNVESCGTSGLECYGIADPTTPAEATTINARIAALNAVAGCTVFLAVPSDGNIPANSNFIFFLGAYNCDFDNISTNLNFSNHCADGVQYYAVFGLGDGGGLSSPPCSNSNSGYFSNSADRTSRTYVYNGGDNTNAANYSTNAVTYTPAGGSPGWVSPSNVWMSGGACIPMASQLPIELVKFEGQVKGKMVILYWQTATEKDNAYMEVQRSRDGIHFYSIGKVAGNGTSVIPQFYTFKDEQPLQGLNYYRLRQVDWDGSETFHKVIAVPMEATLTYMRLFPTQATDVLNVMFNEALVNGCLLKMIDVTGRVVQQISLAREVQQVSIPIENLPKGVYVLQLQRNHALETLHFFKL